MPPLRIVIADDHRLVREALRMLIEADAGARVVGEAADGAEALELLRRLEPDILLLDLAMPRVPGFDALRYLLTAPARARVLVLTASIVSDEIVKAIQLGARGVVMKDAASEELLAAIAAVAAGDYWIGRSRFPTLKAVWQTLRPSAEAAVQPGPVLTPREREIAAAVVAAYANKDIAARFGISEKTVKHHLTSIYQKLGVSNRLELVLFAVNHDLDLPELPE